MGKRTVERGDHARALEIEQINALKSADCGYQSQPQKVHLLKDLLKSDFPEARLLIFTHNSDWLVDAPVMTA